MSYGGFNTVRLGLGAGGPLANRGVHYRVDYSLNDTDGFIDRTPSRLQSLTSAVAWDASARLSLQVSFDLLDDSIRPYWGNQTADITNAAFFVEDSFAVQSHLKLSAGLRAERIDLARSRRSRERRAWSTMRLHTRRSTDTWRRLPIP